MRRLAWQIAMAGMALWSTACGSEDDPGGSGGAGATGGGGSTPASACGNDVTEAGEACDGSDLNGFTCATIAATLTSGNLACRSDCSGYEVSACNAEGQTITAASCEQDAVQAAIDQAGDGDTVQVPAGQCTWTSPDGCDRPTECAPVVILEKAIVLQGAGSDSTVITCDIPEGWAHSAVLAQAVEGKPFRVTGFGFVEAIAPAVTVRGDNQSFRIDHLRIQPPTGEAIVAISVLDRSHGLVDHCEMDDAEVIVLQDEEDAWARPLSLGTAMAVYIEDSTFNGLGDINDVVDGRSGARFVFRHNTLTNLELHCHGIEGGGDRGTHSWEFYGNTGICDGTINCYRLAHMRGGTGAVFDNLWTGDWSETGFELVHQCVYLDCTGFKACDGYPCHDQIGRTTDHDQDGVQDLVPVFEWDNALDDGDLDLSVRDGNYPEMADYIQEGRDFYGDVVSYDAETDSYVATYTDDDGTTRSWRYRPYVYPHPLVQIEDDLSSR